MLARIMVLGIPMDDTSCRLGRCRGATFRRHATQSGDGRSRIILRKNRGRSILARHVLGKNMGGILRGQRTQCHGVMLVVAGDYPAVRERPLGQTVDGAKLGFAAYKFV